MQIEKQFMHDDMLTMDVKCVIEVEENKALKVEWYDINVTIKFIDWDGVGWDEKVEQ